MPLPPEWLRVVHAVGFDYDVCDVPQAVAVLKSNAYHAALVNLTVAEQAFDLIGQVRSIPYCRQVPIVALAERADLNSAFGAGASFAVPRSVAPDLLENTLGAIYRIAVGLRRQYARYRVELPLTLTLDGRSIEAKATDIGTGGMALVASEPLTQALSSPPAFCCREAKSKSRLWARFAGPITTVAPASALTA